ncbi:terminase [Pseudoxanthomonas mexicana]|uniref:terminase small subunit n=1 Tax=Pseudoxanthomonas mexicana TaxID=128785 RepID=UPI0013897592|nr:terminase small subunit [Pseudoxanthomonas mexicana]KAF1728301.1 terminase [Pseudoxanthomonas mexicana]
MTAMTKKQQAFVTHKVAGCTNRDAAIAAGYAPGSAAQAGDRLAKHPAVRKAIAAATKVTPGVDTKTGAPTMPRGKYTDPKSFLLDVMNLDGLPIAVRADAAFKLMPYMHARMGETGKKETTKENARKIARGGRSKFATRQAPPKLTVVRND